MSIPAGYYAIHDPADPDAVTYWRQSPTGLNPWPAKATYGPILFKSAIPAELRKPGAREDYRAFVNAWYRDVRYPWRDAVEAGIGADLAGCARRFAELAVRCCACGRALTEDYSKVVGIGPECRRDLDPASLAAILTPLVGQAHAAHLNANTIDPTPERTPR